MPARSGGLEKMKVTAYTDANFTSKLQVDHNPFDVWINPASYTEESRIRYTDRQGQGASGPSPSFNKFGQETVSFELVFDATGVVALPNDAPIPETGVTVIVDRFKKLLATMNGKIHRANFIALTWGRLRFEGVLNKMTTQYTLFKPNGVAVRAKLNMTFLSYYSEQRLQRLANASSPDLTHHVTVDAGDTLPLLCHRIYGDSGYYLQVAQHNGLANFRSLRPGMKLRFPPLTGTA